MQSSAAAVGSCSARVASDAVRHCRARARGILLLQAQFELPHLLAPSTSRRRPLLGGQCTLGSQLHGGHDATKEVSLPFSNIIFF
jgi:hypothetical protein